ncbi:hypothetical protein ACFXIY_10230 [Streptomyces albidoflavus]
MIRYWPAALGINALLGVTGVVPFFLVWYVTTSWLMGPPPEENDGMWGWLPIVALFLVPYAALWTAVNRGLARRSSLAPRVYWPLSVLITLLPFSMLVLNTE